MAVQLAFNGRSTDVANFVDEPSVDFVEGAGGSLTGVAGEQWCYAIIAWRDAGLGSTLTPPSGWSEEQLASVGTGDNKLWAGLYTMDEDMSASGGDGTAHSFAWNANRDQFVGLMVSLVVSPDVGSDLFVGSVPAHNPTYQSYPSQVVSATFSVDRYNYLWESFNGEDLTFASPSNSWDVVPALGARAVMNISGHNYLSVNANLGGGGEEGFEEFSTPGVNGPSGRGNVVTPLNAITGSTNKLCLFGAAMAYERVPNDPTTHFRVPNFSTAVSGSGGHDDQVFHVIEMYCVPGVAFNAGPPSFETDSELQLRLLRADVPELPYQLHTRMLRGRR